MIPFFSIIIPAYNVENYIGRAITSIFNQSFQDYEIIIVNDGSVDKTSDTIDEYTKKNEKIKILNHIQNESQHVSRIDGVAASNGQYVMFLDADDYFSDDSLNFLYNEIQKNPGFDFYEFGYIRQPSCEVVLPSFAGEDRFTAFFTKFNCPVPTIWNKVYNSTIIKKSFASLERVYINNAEDVYESIVISYYAKNTYTTNEVIINYSVGTGISTSYKDYKKTLDFLASTKKTILHIQNFLIKINQNINLNDLNYQFLCYCINNYINNQKDENDKINLFLKLNDYFNDTVILDYLYNKEKSCKELEISYKEEIINILNSKNYRFGKILLYPLRILKKVFYKK